ncbi:MAG: hypothetical protein ACRENB_05940 [Gemmatimonadales bacterium]
MATRALGSTVLLLVLAACGGGGDPAATPAAPAVDDESTPAPAVQTQAAQQAPAPKIDESQVPGPGQPLVREIYSYSGGPRDPFESVLAKATIGPEFGDLTLVAIYYDTRSPGASVVVLRDRVSGKRYTVRMGERLGRMRVIDVRPKDVTFAIDDYGTERQESLTLRKQEDTQ